MHLQICSFMHNIVLRGLWEHFCKAVNKCNQTDLMSTSVSPLE